ncbi:MAG: Uma2 family endonuclease [Cytophagia bacterium]|nr:MAG: Uma2 family endonuclease [Cytophagia bacterium]
MSNITIKALQNDLIQWIGAIDDAAVLKNLLHLKKKYNDDNKKKNKKKYFEEKSCYSLADLKKIVKKFPKDKKWKFQDIIKYFPKNLQHKVEILNNKIIIMASPSTIHQEISNDLSFLMTSFVKKNKLGKIYNAPMDTKFDDDNLEQPDILFIAITRLDIITKNFIDGAPDLIVEIMSPANKKKERDEKHDLYEKKGVKEYWTIFPKKREIIVEILENQKYKIIAKAKKQGIIQSSVLNGFAINIEDIMPKNLFQREK